MSFQETISSRRRCAMGGETVLHAAAKEHASTGNESELAMSEHVPSMNDLRLAWREYRQDLSSEAAEGELCSFFAAHDQGIRDAVKPPELTAREHLEAAFDKAHPVPKWRNVPVGVTIIARRKNGDFWAHARGWTSGAYDPIEVRTLEPLPPLIPDDCNAVWASTREDESRRVWVRSAGCGAHLVDLWDDGRAIDYTKTSDLINPVPVPPEEES